MEKTWNTFWETGRIDDYLEICREKESAGSKAEWGRTL